MKFLLKLLSLVTHTVVAGSEPNSKSLNKSLTSSFLNDKVLFRINLTLLSIPHVTHNNLFTETDVKPKL
ncbi:hypothetical protein HERIO_2504 [Hepatospora eriocheir]|uniref:Uncharacterized protein n=1 Tax=Hepatospora eriocheir TaxID=1081669 RepID=A0A1X0Q6P7_9MICR|nr:hypothetical protein HERIO_2504 [Hepatospora eriocheir]